MSSHCSESSDAIADDLKAVEEEWARVPLFNYVMTEMVGPAALEGVKVLFEEQGRRHTEALITLFETFDPRHALGKSDFEDKIRSELYSERCQDVSALVASAYEDKNVSMTLWILKKEANLPMHSHPGRVVAKVLLGSVQSTSGIQGTNTEFSASSSDKKSVMLVTDESADKNRHAIKGLESVNIFLEVTFPAYSDERHVCYYTGPDGQEIEGRPNFKTRSTAWCGIPISPTYENYLECNEHG